MFFTKKVTVGQRQQVTTKDVVATTFGSQRYLSTKEKLDSGSIVEDFLPKDPNKVFAVFREIHRYDTVGGPGVDLIAELPFSDFTLTGVSDSKVLEVFQKSLDQLKVRSLMPLLAKEFLVIGRVPCSLLFDEKEGIWTDIIPHEIESCEVTPIPLYGYDPKIDLKPSTELKKFIQSNDPRDANAKKEIPAALLAQLKRGGRISLEPTNTLYLARKLSPNDLGTSVFTRILPLYALEKALFKGTIASSQRRQRAIMHITAGIDGQWEPTQEELDQLVNMFLVADQDPLGATISTRTGVEISEVKQGNDFWKISDEIDFINAGKMRGLGINESFLSGESNYNTMEVALSVFLATVKTFREILTQKIFYDKLFPTLARVHGFVQRKGTELTHNYRVVRADNADFKDLLIPKISWNKRLEPSYDQSYLEILSTLAEKGLPIPLKIWASAGGLSLSEILDSLDEDLINNERVKEWKKKAGGEAGTEDTWATVQGSNSNLPSIQKVFRVPKKLCTYLDETDDHYLFSGRF